MLPCYFSDILPAINAPTSGAREHKDLPPGDAPIQLFSLATPNGIKVHILLEELGVDYDAHGNEAIDSRIIL